MSEKTIGGITGWIASAAGNPRAQQASVRQIGQLMKIVLCASPSGDVSLVPTATRRKPLAEQIIMTLAPLGSDDICAARMPGV
jgi:hypothetical protein